MIRHTYEVEGKRPYKPFTKTIKGTVYEVTKRAKPKKNRIVGPVTEAQVIIVAMNHWYSRYSTPPISVRVYLSSKRTKIWTATIARTYSFDDLQMPYGKRY